MTRDEVTSIVIDTIKSVSSKKVSEVTLETDIHDIMDSLDHATLVIELNDKFPEAKLVQNEDFFRVYTVNNIVEVICKGLGI